MLVLPATFDHLGGVCPLATASLTAPTLIPPPLDTYYHQCHLCSNTETLITHATGPAALVGLLPADDDAFRRRCPRRWWHGATYHTRKTLKEI
jgi:hypothetical protein